MQPVSFKIPVNRHFVKLLAKTQMKSAMLAKFRDIPHNLENFDL